MRLKKADRDKYLKQIRDSKDAKVVSFGGTDGADYAWLMLAWDHFQRLRLDLDHIGSIPLTDKLRGDTGDGEPVTRDYLRHYSDDYELVRIRYEIRKAETGLQYLRNLVIEEEQRRNKSRPKQEGGVR